jgi:predicted NUDIX family phosphoesterase
MITNVAFLNQNELMTRHDSLETWSQICLDSLERLLA